MATLTSSKRTVPAIAAAVVVLASAACSTDAERGSSEEPPAATQEPSASPDPSATPDPSPSPEGVRIPECEELIPDDAVHELANERWQLIPDDPAHDDMMLQQMGPAAASAVERAEQDRRCMWGIPNSDGLIQVYVAELPAEVRDELLAELRASDYVESEAEGATVFTYEFPEPGIGPQNIWYGFEGEVWTVSLPIGLGELALDGMREANPQL